MSADHEIVHAIQQDRIEELEKRLADLEQRIAFAKALLKGSPFGWFHLDSVLDGNYASAKAYVQEIADYLKKWSKAA